MLIGVVSDTHGHLPNTQLAVRMLESLQVEAVLHCGDIGTPQIPPLFQRWPTHFVFGNCDYDRAEVAAAIRQAGLQCHDRFADFMLAERRIAVIHSDDQAKFESVLTSKLYDLICYGHTHVAKQEHIQGALVLNPGALYRANPLSIAVVDLNTLVATIIPVA